MKVTGGVSGVSKIEWSLPPPLPPPPWHGGTAGTGDTGNTSADHPHTTRHSGGPV